MIKLYKDKIKGFFLIVFFCDCLSKSRYCRETLVMLLRAEIIHGYTDRLNVNPFQSVTARSISPLTRFGSYKIFKNFTDTVSISNLISQE